MIRRFAHFTRWLFAVVAAWPLVSGSPSPASDDFWAAPVNGVWQNGANWADGTTPGGGDAAFINLAGAYTVTFNADPSPIQALIVAAAADVTFRSDSMFNISTLEVTSASGSKQVLVDGATLTLGTSGGIFNPDRPLHLTLGNELAPTLHALIVQNNATLNVPFGSDVAAHGLVIIGTAGDINVLGSGSTLTTPQAVNVGWVGDGTLSIQNGGSVMSSAGSLGTSAGSNGIVGISGAGSAWTNSGSLHVGDSGTGTLNVTAGGSVTSNLGRIGHSPGSSGTVSIDGANSQWNITNDLRHINDSKRR
jgi:T5SS/PEP-CTERM-associated repeat protein